MASPDALDRLLTHAVTAGVIQAEAHPMTSGFARALHVLLLKRGFASYHAGVGMAPRDLLRAVRETLPDTAVIFIDYAPRDFGILALLLGAARWRLEGRWVVICRAREGFTRLRQRLAYWLVRMIAHAEIGASEDPEASLRTLPARKLPPRSRLASGWKARGGPASVDEILELLRCPRCRAALRRAGGSLECVNGHGFEVVDGIPILLPGDVGLDLEHHEESHPAGDAYKCGCPEHGGWRELGLYKRDLVARLVRQRPVPRASIDVGCGDWGIHHDIVGTIGTEVAVAGDISLAFVQHARQVATAPGRVHHLVFSAEALPFRDGVFDLTYCSEVLEHLSRPELALGEMRRTSAAGRMILTIPNEELTGKLEEGHVQTYGYQRFMEMIRPYVEVDRALGVYWYREPDLDRLARSAWGRARLTMYLRMGEARPRESVGVVVDGRSIRPATW